ncbi:MAG: hypothetical protein V3T82_08170 [Nitrospinaceae bacterium]
MSSKDAYFWMGAGVVQIDGKDYGGDDPLPVSKITTDQLKRWKDSGKIGTRVTETGVGLEAVVKNATIRISALEETVAGKDARISELEQSDRTSVLEDEAGVKDARIVELEKEVADKDVLLSSKDDQIKNLGTQIEELTKPKTGGKP